MTTEAEGLEQRSEHGDDRVERAIYLAAAAICRQIEKTDAWLDEPVVIPNVPVVPKVPTDPTGQTMPELVLDKEWRVRKFIDAFDDWLAAAPRTGDHTDAMIEARKALGDKL